MNQNPEEKPQSKSRFLKWSLVIIILVILGLGSYVTYNVIYTRLNPVSSTADKVRGGHFGNGFWSKDSSRYYYYDDSVYNNPKSINYYDITTKKNKRIDVSQIPDVDSLYAMDGNYNNSPFDGGSLVLLNRKTNSKKLIYKMSNERVSTIDSRIIGDKIYFSAGKKGSCCPENFYSINLDGTGIEKIYTAPYRGFIASDASYIANHKGLAKTREIVFYNLKTRDTLYFDFGKITHSDTNVEIVYLDATRCIFKAFDPNPKNNSIWQVNLPNMELKKIGTDNASPLELSSLGLSPNNKYGAHILNLETMYPGQALFDKSGVYIWEIK